MSVFPRKRKSKLPVILQAEQSECGLACLAMILAFHGNHTGLRGLRTRHSVSSRGLSIARIMAMAAQNGLAAKAVKVDVESLTKLELPCILHWSSTHFVVLWRINARKRSVDLHDPRSGPVTVSYETMASRFSEAAIELRPSSAFVHVPPPPRVKLRDISGKVRGLAKALGPLGALTLVVQLLMLLTPLLMQWVVDRVIVGGETSLLTVFGLSFTVLLLVQVTSTFVRTLGVARLSIDILVKWMGSMFSHLVSLPLSYFGRMNLGDILSRLQSVRAIQQILSANLFEVIIDGIMGVLLFTVMLIYSPPLTAISVIGVGGYILLRACTYQRLSSEMTRSLNLYALQQSHLVETVRGIQSVKVACKEAIRTANQKSLLERAAMQDFKIARFNMWFTASSGAIFGLMHIGVVWLGALSVTNGNFSVGMLLAYIAYEAQFANRAGTLVNRCVELRNLRIHTERVADIALTAPEETSESRGHVSLAGERIEMNVSFAYAEGEPLILKDCQLIVEPGDFIAIVGDSGCGKSTLLKVLVGVHTPVSGRVCIGQKDIRVLGLHAYRSAIGAVMQDDQVFMGTIFQNIAFFDPEADAVGVENAARLAGLHEEIRQMPMGYQTQVGDMGAALSGGQKQRVILARALYRNPSVLVLDEATSHLNIELEELVSRNLQRLAITRIVVAHRPQTINSASKVYRLIGGKLELVRAVPAVESVDVGASA